MATAYTSRDLVEDYLRYKLLSRGVAWRFPPPPPSPPRQRNQVSSSSSSSPSRRSGTSHRDVQPGENHACPLLLLQVLLLHYSRYYPCLAPPRVQVALRRAGDKLERRYRGNLSAHASALLLRADDGGRAALRRSLAVVREELFRDGVNWGRIVAMMELGGALSAEAGGAGQVDDIARWMEESLDSAPLQGWIEDNGGWDAFVELYGESRPPASFWSLRTVFGLAVLGAAGITLGALFTQR
ncbi:apoptosis regulator Bcl-2 isoform X1 [Lates calcarifer]|uniref:Apoptosis regulator Bcl-2 isoform X1 n=1 Tax=Lates calcarifer TaxID=8187 RepID=A0AAJ7PZ49_LATCA|nr:apoptosis regulator Bcl-2 isoform X1 [Lates calcarifer]